MNLNMISKSLLIALPMLALGACSSKTDMNSDAVESTTEQAVEQTMDTTANDTVQTEAMDAVDLTEEELMVKEYGESILATTIMFDFDQSMIKPEFTPILDAHAHFLVANPDKSVTVEGYADEKGTPEYNIALGERRAVAVATYLESMGVAESQINVVSYGEEKPVNLGHNEAAWAENRRAKLVY
ncbi:MAG: peptidoglycan-associated lipoprotein Pal [Psychromonas sp.]|nr:peptidoglycan-associated lipoprotein Pal [Psychromonas sp.]